MPDKYLRHYAEPEARLLAQHPPRHSYQHCLVIPAYRESAALADKLVNLGEQVENLLIILVLNQPDSVPDKACNKDLRLALMLLPRAAGDDQSIPAQAHSTLLTLSASSNLLLVERPQPLPASEGVGLARKLGCDIALALRQAGSIQSRWLHSSDADATLPPDYFAKAEQQGKKCSAIVHPFIHRPCLLPMALYELRLHYYVLGLRHAGSPYAFHTLGSCLSVDFEAYQQVRGFPRRAAAEDFYLLNKVAKLGPVSSPAAPLVIIEARHSDRVPFGTGPAVEELSNSSNPLDETLFYHPDSFHALRALLESVPGLYGCEHALQLIAGALQEYRPAFTVLEQLGIEKCLRHCQQQSRSQATFMRHFCQWFDGFRTLKFIHGLRESGWQDLTLRESLEHPHSIWPLAHAGTRDPQQLLRECQRQLGWKI